MPGARDIPSAKATLGPGGASPGAADGFGGATGTLLGHGGAALAAPSETPIDLDATVTPEEAAALAAAASGAASQKVRTTVLPRRGGTTPASGPVTPARPRFDRVRLLGQGAMGSVELARDNDIRRTVAVKRVLPGQGTEASLLRFADEVRIVGQLEHPSIVPVYDVGRDENGELYLVMKHLQGETMEAILEKLARREPGYAERFTIAHRLHVFFGVLDAIRYAHARGVLHRDLKPANIMIGAFGEVTVLDWGIAKPIATAPPEEPTSLARTLVDSCDERLLETQLGALAGTPLYMSPEQAAGRNDQLDARSDVYALTAMLVEWLTLRHPLTGKTTVTEVLAATISGDLDFDAIRESCRHAAVPVEYWPVFEKGLAKSRDDRYASVEDLERALARARDGHVDVRCPVTLGKRIAHGLDRFIDHHPGAYLATFVLTCAGLLGGVGYAVYRFVAGA